MLCKLVWAQEPPGGECEGLLIGQISGPHSTEIQNKKVWNLHAPLLPAILMQTFFGPSFGKHWTLDLTCYQLSSISLS